MTALDGHAPLVALLGPTNTGKTHRAVERLLEHPTGMMGLPLRLLAREIYDRITARVGEQAVALLTGEEKRIPRHPRYWICTVEAMPVGQEVSFVAVDEIQLVSHPERGHVFTDRLLRARGAVETWFLGSEPVRPLVERLVPTVQIRSHPRLSRLTHAGRVTLHALPPRSAVVAFGVPQVYALAERLRQTRGGAAVVLGALSPRTRNAQVAMYQAGEVDHLVATDAIGMGLNLDLLHVAFAATRKFDGRESRLLEGAELAQIAGRAGRYLEDGTFGTVAPQPELPEPLWQAIERHQFPAQQFAWWRSTDVDSSSLEALVVSLEQRPHRPELRRAQDAIDLECLRLLAQKPEIRALTTSHDAVELLWQACQIPDFGNLLVQQHARLVAEVYEQLRGPRGRLDPDWLDANVRRLDDSRGDIDTLMQRIELTRTWTYVSHHRSWLDDPVDWQQRTRGIEERLSDALHARLVERFVDTGQRSVPRARKRVRHRPEERDIEPSRDSPFARLLSLKLDLKEAMPPAGSEVLPWVEALIDAPYEAFRVDSCARISFRTEGIVAQMTRGTDLLHPDLRLDLPEGVGAGARAQAQRRLMAWTRDLVAELLAPLRHERLAAAGGAVRGLVYQLEQGLGVVPTDQARSQIEALTTPDREVLARSGVALGVRHVYAKALLRPAAVQQRMALYRAFVGAAEPLPDPREATTSFVAAPGIDPHACLAIGFPVVAGRAIRADVIERIDARLRALSRQGAFVPPPEIASWLGCSVADLLQVVVALGYADDGTGQYVRRRPTRKRRRGGRRAAR